MILTFKDKATEHLFHGDRVKKFASFESIARRKLEILH
ncbi:excinuclease ABC subunit A, partial [bacterium]|nr:excinuclease ABC subunit A [bacterium]